MVDQPVRFGLVGYGLWGRHHGKAIAGTAGAELVAVAARSEASRTAAAQDHPGAGVQEDYQRLVARRDVDVVDVVVPNYLHFEVALAALEAGKHVLVEKPMVLAVSEADRLLEKARETGRILAVGHELRLSRLWGRVRRLIDDGVVGSPRYLLWELSRFPYRPGSEGWRFDIRRVGNWILEEPIHFFDLARWYWSGFGDPVRVYARANSRQPDHPELQDNFSTLIEFSGGGFAVICQTLAAFEHHVSCKVTGSDGAIWARWSAPDARHPQPVFGLRYCHQDPSCVEEVPFDQTTGEVVELEQQIEAMVRAVRHGTPPPATGEDGRWSVLLCLAAQRSVETGRPVSLAEVATGSVESQPQGHRKET